MFDDHGNLIESPDGVILLMGTSGAGKSAFINKLVGQEVVPEGHGIDSETIDCKAILAQVNLDTTIAVVDTPGFLDSHRSDSEVFETIVTYLATLRLLGIKLLGIIYFHPITHTKMTQYDRLYLSVLQAMCGAQATKSVIVATTMWDKYKDVADGYHVEQQIRSHWSDFNVLNFDGSQGMAQFIVMKMIDNKKVLLEIQQEICSDGLNYEQTAAGKILVPHVEAEWQQEHQSVFQLNQEISTVERSPESPERSRSLRILSEDKAEALQREQVLQVGRERFKTNPKESIYDKIREARRKLGNVRMGRKELFPIFLCVVSITVNTLVAFL